MAKPAVAELPKPCCAKCSAIEFTSARHVFSSVRGVLVFCARCGAVVAWAPVPPENK